MLPCEALGPSPNSGLALSAKPRADRCLLMELSPLLWKRISADSKGLEVSIPLIRDGASWRSEITGQCFEALGYRAAGGLRVAFHCWSIDDVTEEGMVTLRPMSHSMTCVIPSFARDDLFKTAEVCAGLGGTTHGMLWAGLTSEATMDRSALACRLLRTNGHKNVIHGDVSSLRDVASFHQSLDGVKVGLLAGFPCQPFSKLGRGLAFSDLRAATFFRVLDVGLLIDSSFLMLECVVGAGDHHVVQATMDEYCHLRGHHWTSVILHHDRALPSFRTRWWAIALPLGIPLPDLKDMPFAHGRQMLGQIFPFWPCWSDQDEQQLLLSDEEIEFYVPEHGGDRLLDLNSKAPTLLHSLAHHMVPCPCGCRAAFNPMALQSKGIHGFLVQSQRFNGRLRHPHPMEAALLVGVPHGVKGTERVRDLLPMLGQVASPLQSHWMIIQVLNFATQCPFEQLVWKHEMVVQRLLQGHYRRWPTVEMYQPRLCQVALGDEPFVSFNVERPITVHEVTQAMSVLTAEKVVVDKEKNEEDELVLTGPGPLCLRYGCGFTDFLHHLEELAEVVPPGLHEFFVGDQGQRLLQRSRKSDVAYFSPLMVVNTLEGLSGTAQVTLAEHMRGKKEFVALQWNEGHWLMLHGVMHLDYLEVKVYDGWRSFVAVDTEIWAHRMCRALESPELRICRCALITQGEGPHCGAVALLHLGNVLGLWHHTEEWVARRWYIALRLQQMHVGCGSRYGCGPSREQAIITWLTDFLPAKGVREDRAADRARSALKKLGTDCLERALKSKDPWRALKAAGNSSGKPFQWVQFDELESHIQQRATTKHGASSGSKRKIAAKKVDTMLDLSPEVLELLPDSFEDDNQLNLPMVTLENIKPDMRGVAIVTTDQAASFLKDRKNLSTDAFALVTIGELAAVSEEVATPVQWNAIYRPTMEPIIIHGHLISLGDVAVKKCKPQNEQEIPLVDSTVVRVQIFADECKQDWKELSKGPVKQVVSLIPALQICRSEDCNGNCRSFHPAVDEDVHSVLLDVWSWRWMDDKLKTAKAEVASLFLVHFRIPCSGLLDLLGYSGWSGIYIEPRPAEHDSAPKFSVVWLGKQHTLEDAIKLKRSQDKVLGLARLRDKIGVRTLAKNEMELMKLIFPKRQLVACEIKMMYEAGPFPHNLAKDQVLHILQEWKWSARPLRPIRSTNGGRYSEIGTDKEPPGPFLYTDGGAIAVTKKKDVAEGGRKPQAFMAAGHTLAHVKANTSAASSTSTKVSDPWVDSDPWAAYRSRNAQSSDFVCTDNKNKADAPKKRMDEMEARISKQLEEKLKECQASWQAGDADADMKDDANSKLQAQVCELQAQNSKFEGWFAETGQRMGAVEKHLHSQGQQIQELSGALQTQVTTTSHLQQEVGSLRASFSEDLRDAMERQSNRLEALLEKRPRN